MYQYEPITRRRRDDWDSSGLGRNVLATDPRTNAQCRADERRITRIIEPAASDLVNIAPRHLADPRRPKQLQRTAYEAYVRMKAAAEAAAIPRNLLTITSGYRSVAHQQRLWEAALTRYGTPPAARKWVAPPGGSPHHTGRAIDLWLGTPNSSTNIPALRATLPYTWLVCNASRFGFFPYANEPWHWEFNPPPPDSPVADRFLQAHALRWCTPGQANSATCGPLATPRPIHRVVIHTATAGNKNFVPLANIIAHVQNPPPNPQQPTSAHYYVDRNGDITQMVREANVAFHVVGNNRDTIGIEHADVCNRPDPYTQQLYERSAELVRDIATRNGFGISVFRIDTNIRNNATVIGHVDLGGHADPGPYWDWEYYSRLLRWDGRTPGTRPIRFVAMVSPGAAAPDGWQVQSRIQVLGGTGRRIPNSHCANRNHSYSDTYRRARANTPGSNVEFPFSVDQAGRYKVSLWWPNVRNANSETQVEVEVPPGRPPKNFVVNQRRDHGQWNDIGEPFIFTVPITGIVRVRRDSRQAGWILADAVRILKVG